MSTEEGRQAPRLKRKGRHGCYVCGKPTEVAVQVWMREMLPDRDKAGNRRQRSVKSINVSFCREHGEEFYESHIADVPRCSPEVQKGTTMGHARAQSNNSGWGGPA